jgi:NADPH:quinone reductase-like Zn-dependent oxidoreductase
MTPQQKYMSTQRGVVPHHELSPQELAELFPKVRSIGDDSSTPSSFFADKAAFDQSRPAHLQASIPRRGPQSLFEYEYETGVHMYAAYAELGSEATCPMRVCSAQVPLPACIGPPKGREKNVIVQVEASTVSQTDCSIREGDWWGEDRFLLPNAPGVDVVGRIFSLDPETKRKTGFMKGERVMSLVQWGGNSRYISLDPTKLVKLPEYVDPAMASCLAETYLTAFQVLHIDMPQDLRYELQSLNGTRTLIIGKAITNLGRAISDLGKIAGGKVYALAKERHFTKVSELGIRPRNVDSLDWWNELDGKIDTIVCIDQDVATIYYKLLKASGRVVMIRSATSGTIQIEPKTKTDIDSSSIRKQPLRRNQRPQQQQQQQQQQQNQPADATKVYDVYAEWKTNVDLCKEDLHHLVDLLVRKQIQPTVLDRIPLNRVGQAQQMINGRSIKGYIVCEPWLVAKSRAIAL